MNLLNEEITSLDKKKYNEAWIWKLLSLPFHVNHHQLMLEYLTNVRKEKHGHFLVLIWKKFNEEARNGQETIRNRLVQVSKTKKEEISIKTSK